MSRWIVVLFVFCVGCGDDDFLPIIDGGLEDVSVDSGADAGEPTGIEAPEPPAPTAEPICPDEWNASVGCAPPAEPPACDSRFFALPGETQCQPVGSPCPEGFPDVVGDALYVRPGAGGDGSEARPFSTIAAALALAGAGTTVVLSEGEFAEGVYLPEGVGLLGSCSATVLRGDDDATSAALEFGGTGTFARNLTIRSELQTGVISFDGDGLLDGVTIESALDVALYVDGGRVRMQNGRIERPGAQAALVLSGELEMDNVEVTGAEDPQVAVAGGRSTLNRVLLRDPRTDEEGFATGLYVVNGARADLEDITIIGAGGSGITVLDSGVVVGRRVHVRGTRASTRPSALGQGTAIFVARDGRVEVNGGVFEDNLWGALQSTQTGRLDVSDIWIRETRNGVTAVMGGVANINRAVIRGDASGLIANEGDVEATDVRIDGAGSSAQGNVALYSENGGHLNVTRCTVGDYVGYGLFNQGGHSRLVDATFEIVRANTFPTNSEANAVILDGALSAELERVRIESTAGNGIVLIDSTATMEDIDIRDTRWSQVTGGRALVAFASTVEVTRLRVSMPSGWGIDLYRGSELSVQDYEVRAIDAGPFGWGVGVHAREGSHANITDAHVASARGVAIWAQDEGTRITAQGLVVQSVEARTCAMPECQSEPAGIGVGAYDGAQVTIADFSVEAATLCGVQVGPGAGVDLDAGEISGCAIGACVHAADYVLSRLTSDVAYEGNELSIDTVSLPIPEAPTYTRPE
ncbi:MAG: right-handed parallel beta-helix repeat-containing protein [Polyangiales bacterium]